MNYLEELGDEGAKGNEAGGEMKFDFFDHLVTKLSKEINDLMIVCKNTLFLPQEHVNKMKKESNLILYSFIRSGRLMENSCGFNEKWSNKDYWSLIRIKYHIFSLIYFRYWSNDACHETTESEG